MFRSARLKLTAWYALTSFLVSLFFSGSIYLATHRQLEMNERRLEMRLERMQDLNPAFIPPPFEPHRQDFIATDNNIKINLIYINLIILALSSLAGYFLAGRTLRPIKQSVDKQNRFIADASHELRTPLTALQTSIEVGLRDKKLDARQARLLLSENLTDIERLRRLSNNLLTLAALQSAPVSADAKSSLKEALDEAVKNITPMARRKNIKVKVNVDAAGYQVAGNQPRLAELFTIFLDNAIKYSPQGSPVTVTVRKYDGTVTVAIKDRGIGIKEADLPHIFERFYRADKSRSHNANEGYGLGLAIAKEILEHFRGTVEATSKMGKGTTFTIQLPFKR